jgi:hypothetical protein
MLYDFDNLTSKLLDSTSVSFDPDDTIILSQRLSPLALLTIASEVKHKPAIIHSWTQFEYYDDLFFRHMRPNGRLQ